ncbi:fumarylacetoacetate hydrolase family protein [Pseudomonas sp. S 311-6]|uniref:4-oxalocrotonate decarboxylase n=1 Tax=Kerstersia gyiorum TaxID=206506 RepID=A0A171KQ44_9BURK|nr:fumarylacetoacetate hydrolase family protein [Kerstersia gyiorum]KKO71011.1 4-oxalocrotonate decarboxylase [Kerstersia gyiorum]MCO7640500.1 fumarylacetoacetate hydrolase family protein [Pseudomonas sp. S 311-6]MCR4157821.1 fumarylacetoacetate hydrolase family protein [Kerstersia gyiorum]QBR42127.1 4-oxalocrotonate decarboxylase [Kerstersia gyiorum]
MSVDIQSIAAQLDGAALHRQAVPQFAPGSFTLAQAYDIQRASVACRQARGDTVCGIKLGFTSRAKMVQMGVDDLIWGWLTRQMREEEAATVDLGKYIHPRVEPEVCFLTRRAIDRPLNALEAVDYLEAVAPALEIIDSRYQDFRFSLEDVVADNCSSAGVVVGGWSRDFAALGNAGVLVAQDGRITLTGSTAAILGHPLRAVVQAARLVAAAELSLPAGSLIMAGAATAAAALAPGQHVQGQINGLGKVEFFTGGHQHG